MTKISRRNFLRNPALAGGAMGLPNIVSSAVMAASNKTVPSDKVNAALISCG